MVLQKAPFPSAAHLAARATKTMPYASRSLRRTSNGIFGIREHTPFERGHLPCRSSDLSQATYEQQSELKTLSLLKRAAHEDLFPSMWPVPGGHIDEGETIQQAIHRETFEETGLIVKEITKESEQMSWTSTSGGASVQLNFVVSAEDDGRFGWIQKNIASGCG